MLTTPEWPVASPRPPARSGAGLHAGRDGGPAVWDSAELLRTLRGNRGAVERAVQVFREDGPTVAQRLRAAVGAGDRAAVQHFAHRL